MNSQGVASEFDRALGRGLDRGKGGGASGREDEAQQGCGNWLVRTMGDGAELEKKGGITGLQNSEKAEVEKTERGSEGNRGGARGMGLREFWVIEWRQRELAGGRDGNRKSHEKRGRWIDRERKAMSQKKGGEGGKGSCGDGKG